MSNKKPVAVMNPKNKTKPKRKRRANGQGKQQPQGVGALPGAASNLMTPGQAIRDARRQTAQNVPLELSNQQQQIVVSVPLRAFSLTGIAMGYVSLALERGYAGFTPNPNFPYWSFVYMFKILSSYVGNQPLPVPQMPYWLLCLCQALSPKKVPYQQGFATYAFLLDNPNFVPNSTFATGYIPYASQYTLGIPDNTAPVNGFPGFTAPAVYPNDQQGELAFANLILFMSSKKGNVKGRHPSDLVPATLVTKYSKNVSVFALNTLVEGASHASVSGWAGQAQLEVPIMNPVLSAFTEATIIGNANTNRFYNSMATVAGDGLWLSVFMSTLATSQEMKARRYPRFHAVDFLEFGDVMAQWVTGVIQSFVNDPQTIEANNTADIAQKRKSSEKKKGMIPAGFPDPTCPLTLQEMLLLLRNIIMGVFKDTQAGVQSMLPRHPESQNDNEFTPYLCSANTCFLTMLDMLLPLAVVENIRALKARKITIKGHDIQWYVPVLGQYFQDFLVGDNYQYQFPDLPNSGVETHNSFAVGALFEKQVIDIKGNIVSTPLVETEISLIDGTNSGSPVWINDPMQLKTLVGQWNKWIAEFNLQAYSMTLTTVGSELGISSLTSVAMTRHWVEQPQSVKIGRSLIVDSRIKSDRALGNTVYSTRLAIADSSQSIILAVPYEEVLTTWVLPVNFSNSGANINDQSVFTRWQEIMGEPYSSCMTTNVDGTILAFNHFTYASRMVKSRAGQLSSWDQFFVDAAKEGRGGILSGIGTALDSILGF